MSRWRSAPGVWWAVEADGVAVVQPAARQARHLTGREAVAWDLAARGADYKRWVRSFDVATGLSEGEAAAALRGMLEAWAESGLVEEQAERG
jgi:hypothetical protein